MSTKSVTRLTNLKEIEIGYLAGLIDSNGTFYISEVSPRANRTSPELNFTLVIYSPDRKLLHYWIARTGMGSLHRTGKDGWHWRLSAFSAEMILRVVYEHLMTQKDKARLAMLFRGTFNGPRRTELEDEVVTMRQEYRAAMLSLQTI